MGTAISTLSLSRLSRHVPLSLPRVLGLTLSLFVVADIRADEPVGIVRLGDTIELQPTPATLPPPAPFTGESSGENHQIIPAHPRFLRDDPGMPLDDGAFYLHAERATYDPRIEEEEAPVLSHVAEGALELLNAPIEPFATLTEWVTHSEHDTVHAELNHFPIGIQPIPSRPDLVLETNDRFLDTGFLSQGVTLPTGAVWRPSFWVFGTYRMGYNYQERPENTPISELATRLDLFGQLNLSGTERLLVGLRPLDEQTSTGRRFTSYDLDDGNGIDGTNIDIQTLFFEGDFGEIFPNLDPFDTAGLDYGFSVGRQPMLFQQGLLINEDRIDAVTVTRNTLYGNGNLNLRITGAYAWGDINRNNNQADPDAQLVGLFTESDFRISTVNADIAYVSSNSNQGSLLAFALSAIQRIHGYENTYNTSFHVLGSIPTDGETAASGRGLLLFGQSSWTPHHTHDLVYLNGFWAIDQFTSPARGTLAGGPLGQTGILFSAPGLGRVGAPLSNQASDVVGASLGYQLFFNDSRQQVIFEAGGREPTNGADGEFALGSRLQQAIGQHWIVVVDGFITKQESRDWGPGARLEFLAKF